MSSDFILGRLEELKSQETSCKKEIQDKLTAIKFNSECLSIINLAERASLSLVKEIELELTSMLQTVFDDTYAFKFQIDVKDQIRTYPTVYKGKFLYENISEDLGDSVSEIIDLTFTILSLVFLGKSRVLFLDELLGKLDAQHWLSYMNWLVPFCVDNQVQIIMNTHHDVNSDLFNDTAVTVFKVSQLQGVSSVSES